MWHQFGLPPDSPDKGIFLQATDIPKDWLETHGAVASSYNGGDIKSFVDLLGLDQEPRRLGEVAVNKTVKEAVVAVPFVERDSNKKFFTIKRDIIEDAMRGRLPRRQFYKTNG